MELRAEVLVGMLSGLLGALLAALGVARRHGQIEAQIAEHEAACIDHEQRIRQHEMKIAQIEFILQRLDELKAASAKMGDAVEAIHRRLDRMHVPNGGP